MQYLTFLLPLAALAAANPLERRGGWSCDNNACLAAVTGKAALGDDSLRKSHCVSFLATTVTPPAVTVTSTITVNDDASKSAWKRSSVTVCPNEVPNYASACDVKGYSSACACYGFTDVKTTTLAPTTTTKTVYVKPTGACAAASTVTVTVTAPGGTYPTGKPTDKCLSDAQATTIVNHFIELLEYTSYKPAAGSFIPAGRGYHYNTSAVTLAPDFVDISDSINFMAGFPIGTVTFANKTAFDYGQGVLQPEVSMTTLNIFHDCKNIVWRWHLSPAPNALPVTGINYFEINDNGLIQKNYAEFNSGAYLQDAGQKCAINTPPAPVFPPAL